MRRPPSDFKVDTRSFRDGMMVETADLSYEPRESAAFWKAVADGQKARLDRTVIANKENRDGRIRAEHRVEQLKAQIQVEKGQE
jgi:hypothetical protein